MYEIDIRMKNMTKKDNRFIPVNEGDREHNECDKDDKSTE